jgi:hypothetical protein
MSVENMLKRYGTPQTLVLYETAEGWKFAIYTDRFSLEGKLSEYHGTDAARVEVESLAARILETDLTLRWENIEPGWWVASVQLPAEANRAGQSQEER